MRLTEYLQQEYIKEIQERNNEKSGLQQSNNEIDEIFLKENEIIEQEIYKLTKIKFQQKTQQIVNNFYQKLLTLSKVFQDKQKLKKESLSLLKFLENSQKQMKIVENSLIQKDNLVLYFQITIKNLIQYYKFEYEQFCAEFDDIILILKKIIIIKYEIEASFLSNQVKFQISENISEKKVNSIQKLRFQMQKEQLKLMIFKNTFQNILSSAQQYTQELQQLKEIINLDEFLLDIIRDYPIRAKKSDIKVYKKTIQELNSMELTKIQFQNKLSKYQGILEFNIFQLRIEESINDSEKLELEFIEKEFGELFKEKIPQHEFIDKILQIIEELNFSQSDKQNPQENLSQQKLKFEQEKLEGLLIDLRKIKDFSKNQNKDKIGKEFLKKLIKQIEKIIQVLNNPLNQYIENNDIKQILKITINGELTELTNILREFNQYCTEQEKQQLKQNNLQCDVQRGQQDSFQNEKEQIIQNDLIHQEYQNIQVIQNVEQIVNDSDDQLGNKINIQNNENCRVNLQIIANIIRLQQIKIQEEKQFLIQLLQVIQDFQKQSLIMKEETKEIINQHFNSYFYTLIKNFDNSQSTNIDLQQKENENFKTYFDRIQITLQQEVLLNDNIVEKRNSKKIYLLDFFQKLKISIKKQLVINNKSSDISMEQEHLIQLISKIYLNQDQQDFEEEPSQHKCGLFDTLKQKYKDFKNNDEWKIKQGLVLTLIQVSSNTTMDSINSYCQSTLIKLWKQEKDQRIRKQLKNQDLINMQINLFKKDWKIQEIKIAQEMQQLINKMDNLQISISHEVNPNKRDQQLQELNDTNEQLDQYIQNISEMGKQFNLTIDFINQIRKELIKVEVKIKQMKDQLNCIGNDLKFLRGKSVQQLLEIRKWKVLKEAAINNVKSLYVPLKTQRKGKNKTSNLMNLEQFNDKQGEVNEFLFDEKEIVLLIHGVAGSGKSTTAKKIEEFIWKLHNQNIKIGNKLLIPIYISLPSLKNPVYQVLEEALHQEDYGFDNLQIKECKELLEKNEFRFLLIMDGYDEMKLENISKNLYITNKVNQNWSNPLVIFTTRSEIFTTNNYVDWFATENKQKFKEIQLLKFDEVQQKEYLEKYTLLSIKLLILDIYEWQAQVQGQQTIDVQNFELCWEKLYQQLLKQNLQLVKSETLLNQQQIEKILQYLQNHELFNSISIEVIRSLKINLQKLWSIQNYENMMKLINLDKLVETPYMMEIIVSVLPQMIVKATEIFNLRQTFIINCSKMLKEVFKSKYLIKIYQQQQKNFIQQQNNNFNIEQIESDIEHIESKKKQDIETQKKFALIEVEQILYQIDYKKDATEIWNKIEQNQILKEFQISSDLNDLNRKLTKIFEANNLDKNGLQTEGFLETAIKKLEIENERIIELFCYSLKEQNLTSYDFYYEFINEYHFKQIEKQRNLGKSINTDRFLHDLLKYSIKLAKQMSAKELTQVQFKQQGLIYKDEKKEEEWLDEFFNDDCKNGSYKKDIRSCSLVQQKGTSFQFVHKSIQEFLIAADLYEILLQSKEFDARIYSTILEIQFSQNQNESLGCYIKQITEKHFLKIFFVKNLISYQKQQEKNAIEEKVKKTIELVYKLRNHDFNIINYSTKTYEESRKFLIQKIYKDQNIIQFLKFIVHLTSIDEGLIQGGSNSLNILVEMKVDLTQQSFRNVRIKNTSLIGASFSQCDLSGSEFENVKIHGINLNCAILINCIWKNLQINELHKIEGHNGTVNSVCYSYDGNIIASGSSDKTIHLWDVKSGEVLNKLYGHNDSVKSVSFSSDGLTLASGSEDNSIRIWDINSGQEILTLLGHDRGVITLSFSSNASLLASGSWDKSIRLWNVNTGESIKILQGHSEGIQSVCFSPDDTILASCSRDKSIFIWSVRSGDKKKIHVERNGGLISLSFSPDGSILVCGSCDKSIQFFDVKLGTFTKILQGHEGIVTSLSFSPDGLQLASGSSDKSIRLWDVKSGDQSKILLGHNAGVSSVQFSPDGVQLATGSWDKSIRLWDIKSGEEKTLQGGHNGSVNQVSISPDGITFASTSEDESIRIWDINSGEEKKILKGHLGQASSICFTPDGTQLASGNKDATICIWDITTGEQKTILQGHNDNVISLCFSPDGYLLASSSEDTFIIIWDARSGAIKYTLQGHSDYVRQVCFSSNSATLASCSEDESIRLWDIESGKEKKIINGHDGSIYSLCFSPDGIKLASGGEDKSIYLWDVKSGEKTKILKGHNGQVSSLCFSTDGTVLASGSWDNTIRLWDVKLGEGKCILQGHNDYVLSVCFSPDSSILVSGSADKSICIWNINCQQEKEIFPQSLVSDALLPKSIKYSQFNSINIQNIQQGNQIYSQADNHLQQIRQCNTLNKLKNPIFYSSIKIIFQVQDIVTLIRISKHEQFTAQSALIMNGEFTNHLGMNLRKLFQQKGSFILKSEENQDINSAQK
ncbi:unnamed protein product [Paramecium primaurelia]|uniref:NACHT domain-containing protein n=1 Tax=Paramecium primaurelia TaxID=5886 RepID=A0A8S1MTP5_PARPR|nr:unnamed protein product [Paramecium primaurelia]